MKIGITCYPSAGGSGVMATELGRRLARQGHEIHFISSALPMRLRAFDENIFFHEVIPESYPLFQYPPYDLSLATKMYDVAVLHNLDILHVHYAIPFAVSALLAREMLKPRKITTVTTLHGTDITLVGVLPSFQKVTQFSINHSDGVTAVSRWLKQQTLDSFEITKPVEVITNFLDTQVFRPRQDLRYRCRMAPKGEKIVMHISNFRPVKNVETVVRVFARLREHHDARLIFIGEGPEQMRAEQLAHTLGVEKHVAFMGNQEFIEELLPAADLFLLPSLHESFGLVALEALSSGVPVIATSRGGTGEVIRHGITGFLHDPDDVEGMVQTGLRILDDPDLRARIGDAARKDAVERFDVDYILPQYLAFYDRCRTEVMGRTG